jgi:probable selenium-dependent hydroxylase accessory protein YqeC
VDVERDSVTKADGVSGGLVARMRDVSDAVLVEGDGSRRRPFKAPGEHEPVVPPCTSLLVPVVGIDVVGSPLTDEHVHRARIVANLAGVEPGTPVTEQLVAEVIGHADGGRKRLPPQARFQPLINKIETPLQQRQAEQIATDLLRRRNVDGVCIGAVESEDPILRRFTPTAIP